jgi:tetratricopeptide (TPR) repeat protein
MRPCITAVVHGCRAGQAAEALDTVFVPRIRQSDQQFSTHRLGAWSTDLIALSEFFEVPWQVPHGDLDATQKAYVLKEAGFSLWALGWLSQALVPLQTALSAYDSDHQSEQIARVAGNLSAIHVDLGQLTVAEGYAKKAVIAADESEVCQQRITRRASLAHVLHQMGRLADAAELFKRSEELQAEEQPHSPRLYARSGYQYWEFLLDQAERQMLVPGSHGRQMIEHVHGRAEESLVLLTEEKLRSPTLSDIALCHLTLGRVGVLRSAAGDKEDDDTTRQHLDSAVMTLQEVGAEHWLPAALIARASCHRTASRWKEADEDVRKGLSLSQAHEMPLQEADARIEAARLCLALGRVAQSREHIAMAQTIIGSRGYHRREAFVATLLATSDSTSA